eukprot:359328-Chlamydomonas_euryale.AAC.5
MSERTKARMRLRLPPPASPSSPLSHAPAATKGCTRMRPCTHHEWAVGGNKGLHSHASMYAPWMGGRRQPGAAPARVHIRTMDER